jgi:hypothetical protein
MSVLGAGAIEAVVYTDWLAVLFPAVSKVWVIAVEPDAVTVTVAVCVSAVPFAVADTAFASATVELNVPVATPFALVGPAG